MSIQSKNITPSDIVPVRRALISTFDKSGLDKLAPKLVARDIVLISTGGTRAYLQELGLSVLDISEITQFPEILDGRVKTLHPNIHGGILAVRNDPDHQQQMDAHKINGIDLIITNLYPFEQTIEAGNSIQTCIENIDIGGPAMIRAAAKNYAGVTILTDPEDYGTLLDQLELHDGGTCLQFREQLAAQAFGLTAHYDTAIANYLAKRFDIAQPRHRSFSGKLSQTMRYGENPHQTAAFYSNSKADCSIANATQIQGKQLSYNNVNDANAALDLVSEFDPEDKAAVAIIKHANPCGVALSDSLVNAYQKALACDPVSAFGGIIAINKTLDKETAQALVKIFTEVIVVPDADEEARAIIGTKKNLRLLLTGEMSDPRRQIVQAKTIAGGLLTQSNDNFCADDLELKTVTENQPSKAEIADMIFAFKVAKHVKSNAIVYAKDLATVGIGAGQMSRVDSARIAHQKAMDAAKQAGLPNPATKGSVVASDAFFPFADGLLSAVEAGATCVIQPGGSMRDQEVIDAANNAGISMMLTGVRHFRH